MSQGMNNARKMYLCILKDTKAFMAGIHIETIQSIWVESCGLTCLTKNKTIDNDVPNSA